MPDDELLSASVLRQIGHAQYDKRKMAALEVEQTVKRLSKSHDEARVQKVVDKLIAEYAFSPQANHRKGALLCLAAATVGLGTPTEAHLRQIVPPVLASFTDQDGRVRYYACEALYNIAKVAREPFIIFFNEVFDAMFRLCADAEANVLNAVQFLDNLVKWAGAGRERARLCPYVSALLSKSTALALMHARNLHPGQVLDSVPDLDLLVYLPQLLDGLMAMLSDPNREIRVAAHKAMMVRCLNTNSCLIQMLSGPNREVHIAAQEAMMVRYLNTKCC
ncbi:vacuolar 14 Fab1-binding region-domain-containing protein [Dunaliella salina]|uniref:Vacuolar 14 Fab1-binding region-domain-containing protein n=1 Tax=Dunaliella salina TaxID=3046 RepID=A0ABQ7GT77_DUNSA|nr:vacuolar 14 Fab1-binding region-domain-containing protein [Dunaliella salina]|eukprot:KAF5837786.1 vacuolar 14 Fab1-binding region-domain-containing protein [Dunaliella salina]